MLKLPFGLAVLATLTAAMAASAPPQSHALDRSAAERIVAMINDHRAAHGLPRIPVSASLTRVAEAHALDMAGEPDGGASPQRGRDERGMVCNSHSWSDRGSWTPVCYTSDHRYAQAMWDKPREITGGAFRGNGYEIGYWTGGRVDPAAALRSWQASPEHHAVILQRRIWSRQSWQAIGAGVAGHHAFVWFASERDASS